MRDIAAGRGIKRADHDLTDARGRDCTAAFLEALAAEGYHPTTVAALEVHREERVPAWLVDRGRARFGYVFWERFTPERARKLWGSIHKNTKGDWDKILGSRSAVTIYANGTVREPVDPGNPSGW